MNKCKVLHIAPGFRYGGIEARLVDWYSAIDRNKIQFDIIKVTPDEPNFLVDQIRRMGGKVYSINPLKPKYKFSFYKSVKQIMNDNNYNVVHSHSAGCGYYPLKYAKFLGINKRILHSRTVSRAPGEKHIFLKDFLMNRSKIYATDYFACSPEAAIWAFGNCQNVKIIKNGLFLENYVFNQRFHTDTRKKLSLQNKFVIGYVGRFSTEKNLIFLINIFKEIKEILPESTLLMVGDNNNNTGNNIKKQIYKYNISDSVIFTGRQNKPASWYSVFDIFVSPSHYEGFGTTALEAQINGLPCVISSGFPESVKINNNCYRLSINDINCWIEKILSLQTASRIHNSVERAKKYGYDISDTAKWLENYYLH